MGYKLAGFRMVGCNEIDPKMMRMYAVNHHPEHAFQEPIQEFKTAANLPDALFNLDVLDGSPPCSVFSMAGNREKDWGREKVFREGQARQVLDDLFFHFIDVAERLKPKVVVAENVKGLIFGNAKGYVKEIFTKFRDAGYSPQLFLLNSSLMGVPQRRERVFFVASRIDLDMSMIMLNFGGREATVREAIAGADGSGKPLSPVYKRLWYKVPPGKSFSCAHPKGSFFNSYKLDGDRPAPTVTAAKGGIMAHWKEPRAMSGAEIARLQSFPEDYDYGRNDVKYVCGMSVPPLMMERLAAEIRRQLLKT